MATPGPYPKGTMSVFTKIDLTPFSYGPGETRNSNILSWELRGNDTQVSYEQFHI